MGSQSKILKRLDELNQKDTQLEQGMINIAHNIGDLGHGKVLVDCMLDALVTILKKHLPEGFEEELKDEIQKEYGKRVEQMKETNKAATLANDNSELPTP